MAASTAQRTSSSPLAFLLILESGTGGGLQLGPLPAAKPPHFPFHLADGDSGLWPPRLCSKYAAGNQLGSDLGPGCRPPPWSVLPTRLQQPLRSDPQEAHSLLQLLGQLLEGLRVPLCLLHQRCSAGRSGKFSHFVT